MAAAKGDKAGGAKRASRRGIALALLFVLSSVVAPPARATGPDVVVTGVVQDTSGQPLAEAVIVAVGDGSTLNEQSVRTKADGSYRTIVGLSTTLSVEVDLASYSTRRQTLTFSSPPAGPLTVDFTGAMHGLVALPALFVSNPTGLFVALGSTLQVTGRSYTPGAVVTVSLGAGNPGQQVTADSNGAFSVALLVPSTLSTGTYMVTSSPTTSSTAPVVVVSAAAGAAATATPAVATATATATPAATTTPTKTAQPTATTTPQPTATALASKVDQRVAARRDARSRASAALRRLLARHPRQAPRRLHAARR